MIEKEHNITIVNAHWNNRGDESALLSLVYELKNLYPKSKIYIAFKDGKSIEQFPALENVKIFDSKFKTKIWDIWLTALTRGFLGRSHKLKYLVKVLRESDLIIYSPGGSVINERFFWWKQMEYLLPFICAGFYKIPMFIAAPSMGPYNKNKRNRVLKFLLNFADIICVREDISKKYLKDINIHKNVHVTSDLAFLSKIDIEKNEDLLRGYRDLNEYLRNNPQTVGITITDFQWHVQLNKDENLKKRITLAFREFVEYLEKQGYGVLFIPQLFGNQNDYDFMNDFSTSNTFILKESMDSYFQQYVIAKLFAVVGMRYHSNIFAAKMGTPFIAIIYEEKMQGFVQANKLEDLSLSLDQISFENFQKKFELIVEKNIMLRALLKKKSKELYSQAFKTIKLLKLLKF